MITIKYVTVHPQKIKTSWDQWWPLTSRMTHVINEAHPRCSSRLLTADLCSPSACFTELAVAGAPAKWDDAFLCADTLQQIACLSLLGRACWGPFAPVRLPLISHKTRWHHHSPLPQQIHGGGRYVLVSMKTIISSRLFYSFIFYFFLTWREFYVNKACGPNVELLLEQDLMKLHLNMANLCAKQLVIITYVFWLVCHDGK